MKLMTKRFLSCLRTGTMLALASLFAAFAVAQDAEVKPLPALSAGTAGVLPLRIWKPLVAMTEEHRKECVVFTGDAMPDLQLADLTGKPTPLNQLYGKKLTIVIFRNGKSAQSREQLTRLGRDVVDRFAGKEVNVVAIHVGQTGEQVAKLTANLAKGTTMLVDADASGIAKVSTTSGPKTFVLDSAGKILWFDIEYSNGMSRELQNTIWFYLHGGARKPKVNPLAP
jgi:peroxiredoxin